LARTSLSTRSSKVSVNVSGEADFFEATLPSLR